MLEITKRDSNELEIVAGGKLEKTDYDRMVPRLEEAAEDGPLRVIVRLDDFRGWTPRALLEELRYDVRHRDDFEKVAVVGEKKVEELATKISEPFFSGDVRFFETLGAARAWMAEDTTAKA